MRRFVPSLLLALAACTQSSSEPAPAAASPAPAASPAEPDAAPRAETPPPTPGVRDDGSIVSAVDWSHGSLEQALARAKAEGKLVFVDVGAYWCPPCHRLDEETFVDAAVGEALGDRFVALHVDAEKGEGPDVVQRYKVQAYPTLLVLEASGIEKGRIVDFVPPAELLAKLGAIEAGGNVLADLQAAVESDPDDLPARYRLAHAYALAADADAAKAELSAIEVADPVNELGYASKVAFDRAMFLTYKIEGDLPGAIAAFRTLQARFPDSPEASKAYRQIGRLLCEQGEPKKAVAELDAMLAREPDDTGLRASYGWFAFREHCEPARGLEVVDAGIAVAPDAAELHYLRSELREQLGDLPGALEAMQRASAIEPDSAYYKRRVHALRERMGEP